MKPWRNFVDSTPYTQIYDQKKLQTKKLDDLFPWQKLVGGFNSSEKYESQFGLLFPIYGKTIFMFSTTNQKTFFFFEKHLGPTPRPGGPLGLLMRASGGRCRGPFERKVRCVNSGAMWVYHYPYDPCMEYLPTFGSFMG